MGYKPTRELQKGGAGHQAGAYKFKIIETRDYSEQYGSFFIKMNTWYEDNKAGPTVTDFITVTGFKEDFHEDETNRIFKTICGKVEIDHTDLMNKTGYVVVQKGKEGKLKTLLAGSYFTPDRKDAFGEKNMSTSIEKALAYVYKPKVSAEAPKPTEDDSDSMPF